MGTRDVKLVETRSRGVHTSASLLQPPSSTISDSDEATARQAALASHSHDADESVISELHEENIFENIESSEDSDCDLYRMKTGSRKGLRSHPSKINFELVKTNAGTQHDKQTRKQRVPYNRRNKCHCTFEHEKPPSVMNIPSPNMQIHQAPEIVESFQSARDYQPRRLRSKVRNMFACFQRNQSGRSERDDDDVEAGHAFNTEVYHFDHGSPSYLQTTDCPPHLVSEIIAQRTHYHATKFWAEFFGSINIGVTFLVTFILQFYRFLLYSILRALIVGFLQITSDYLLKPILAVIFNGLLQPQFIFTQNIFQSICNTLEPLTKLIAITLKPLTDCVRAFRIVEVKNLYKDPASGRFQTFQGQNNA